MLKIKMLNLLLTFEKLCLKSGSMTKPESAFNILSRDTKG